MINFVCMPARSSGLIRGRQVADALNASRGPVDPHACVLDIHNTYLEEARNLNDVSLFVRSYDPGLAAQLKRRGHFVGYDIADQMCGDSFFRNDPVKDLSAYAHAECDFYIVNNTPTLKDLEPFANNKPIYVVPHHTVNYDRHVNELRKVERVGYVGLPEQLSAKEDIEKLCAKMGVQFVSIHPNTREECVEVMKTIDVGVVFAEADGSIKPRFAELVRRHKPNTKLSNFQSFGIRTVCTPYVSYVEHGGGASRFEETRAGMMESLEFLIRSSSLMEVERARALAVGQRFHINEIVKLYKNIVLDLDAVRDS